LTDSSFDGTFVLRAETMGGATFDINVDIMICGLEKIETLDPSMNISLILPVNNGDVNVDISSYKSQL
jgi:hypothetical protein